MDGWKTYTAAGVFLVIAVGMGLGAFGEKEVLVLMSVATSLGLYGIGHKIDKLRRGK